MGDRVLISYSRLERMIEQLDDIIEEFRNARDRSNDLAVSIANPYMQDGFRVAAVESESRWDTKRKRLADDLEKVVEHAKGIHESFQEFDTEAAKEFESEQTA